MVEAQTQEGQLRMTKWKAAPVKRPLLSVGRITEAGNKFSPSTVKLCECPAEDGSKSQAHDSPDFAPPRLAH